MELLFEVEPTGAHNLSDADSQVTDAEANEVTTKKATKRGKQPVASPEGIFTTNDGNLYETRIVKRVQRAHLVGVAGQALRVESVKAGIATLSDGSTHPSTSLTRERGLTLTGFYQAPATKGLQRL
jgi:hypothetical protein